VRIHGYIGVVAAILFCVGGCRPSSEETAKSSEGRAMNTSFILEDAELKRQERAGASGDAKAAFRVSEHYGLGLGNVPAQKLWLQRAAERGHTIAQYNLGAILYFEKDFDEAKKWLEAAEASAAASGDAETRREAEQLLRSIEASVRKG
jgi:TPR repeat protein